MDIGYCEAKKGYCKAKWLKIFPLVQKKISKNIGKTTIEVHQSCSVQKTAPKNTYYSKNDNFFEMAKLGHHAKTIGFAKSSLWVKN